MSDRDFPETGFRMTLKVTDGDIIEKMIPLMAFSKVLSCFQKEKHWVLHERGTDARDNAYFFYRYLKEKHPEQKIYYIIDKTSVDYEKVKKDAEPEAYDLRGSIVYIVAELRLPTRNREIGNDRHYHRREKHKKN